MPLIAATTTAAPQDVVDALPLAGFFWLTLLAHEAGHRVAADKRGVSLYLPLIVPAGFGFVGSFGGITRFKGFTPNRETLLDVAMAGPLWGTAASTVLLLLGLGLTVAGLGDVTIDSPALADSFITGLLGQFVLGESLANPEVSSIMRYPTWRDVQSGLELMLSSSHEKSAADLQYCFCHMFTALCWQLRLCAGHDDLCCSLVIVQVQVSSLFVAGWAGLTVNALNLLPTGELDGGRISLALFGRR